MTHLRGARESDVPALAELYRNSVRTLGPEYYSHEAVESWAAFADEAGFRDFVLEARTLIAEDESGPIGFTGIDDTGRIASLFVRPDRARQGVGSRLLEALLERTGNPARLWTHASKLSRPVFERFGFVVLETEVVERGGVEIERYLMERPEGTP